jgi:NADPH:quinone reductase-like Zn-dependent oxidoreductase
MDLQERIASLPPEKRAMLYARLRKDTGVEAPKVSVRNVTVGDGQNFVLTPEIKDVINSLSYLAAPRIAPGEDEIEIQIEASALNFRDLMILLGLYPEPKGMRSSLGADCAGKVVRVGSGVKNIKLGDEVYGLVACNFGAYTTVFEEHVTKKPRNLSFVETAVIPTVYLTAYHGLEKLANLAPGERVLIQSASGGVGLAAIEIAKWKGAEIYATAGTEEKRAYVRSLGIEHVFDSRSLSFAEEIMAVTNGEGVDVVLNSIAGEAIAKGLSILRPFGRFIEIGKRDIYGNTPIGLQPFSKALSFHAIDLGFLPVYRRPYVNMLMQEITDHFEAGHWKPFHIHQFAATESVAAFNLMQSGAHIGKVAFDMHGSTVPVRFVEKP